MQKPPSDPRHRLGARGEDQAADYLTRKGLHVVQRHFQTRWGEIDLICRDRDTWVFVEVKTRSQAYAIAAVDAIHRDKQRRLVNAALSFMKKNRRAGENLRFDAILIEGPELEWIPNAFAGPSYYTF